MRAALLIFLAVVLVGCAGTPKVVSREDFLAEASRKYPDIKKETVIKAAEIVLRQSDPKDWSFRHKPDGFTGVRRYVVYAVLSAASGHERWQFDVKTDNGTTTAFLNISETVTGSSGVPLEGEMNNVALYRLFWNRMDYVLGRRQRWVHCQAAVKQAKADGHSIDLGGLCGETSQGRYAKPPERLMPLTS